MTAERGARYIDALTRVRSVLDDIEAELHTCADGSPLTSSRIAQLLGYRAPMDQCTLALVALADLGVVPTAHGGPFNRAALLDSAPFRLGARAGLDAAATQASRAGWRLIQAIPDGLSSAHRDTLSREADDLRAAIVDLIIAARKRVILASPFWDDDTADDLGHLLLARMRSGVQVDVLGRPPTKTTDAFAQLARRLCDEPLARAFVWSYPMYNLPFGTQTFHFKAIVSDDGTKAYLGSANFTTASLRSRMELGVVFHGADAQRLARILDEVLSIAQPYNH